jgi:mannose-6-phosphate isomerase-like protein (cupin superfamily)
MVSVLRGAEAPQFELPGVTFRGRAAPSRGSAQLCTWSITVAPGLRSAEAHTLDSDEVFMVVAGALQVAPESAVARAGDTVVVPAGSPIQLVNPTDQPVEAIIAVRAGFAATMADGTPIGTPPWAA